MINKQYPLYSTSRGFLEDERTSPRGINHASGRANYRSAINGGLVTRCLYVDTFYVKNWRKSLKASAIAIAGNVTCIQYITLAIVVPVELNRQM